VYIHKYRHCGFSQQHKFTLCDRPSHCTNFRDPDYLSGLISDLTKLRYFMHRKLVGATVISGLELTASSGCSRERLEQTLTTG